MLCITCADAQKKGSQNHVIGFYNLENLFDTIHDDGKNDYEYLPKGKNRWDSKQCAGYAAFPDITFGGTNMLQKVNGSYYISYLAGNSDGYAVHRQRNNCLC